MVLFKLVDSLQHKAWKYLDPRTAGNYPARHELAARCFTRLDDVLKKLFDYAQQRNATVLIMSDHGHGSLDGKAQPNLLLKNWGYLALRSTWQQASTRAEYWIHRFTKGKATRFEQGNRGIERELAVDWSRTQACVVHAGIYGFLYINLKGRGPHGIVPPQRYEALRDELAERLRTVRVPGRNGHGNGDGAPLTIFPEVYKTEELYQCSREENPDLPDLLLAPAPGLAVVRKIRGRQAVRWCSDKRMEGTHRIEGILALGGANVHRGLRLDADIVDIAPTVLAALGLRVPVDMEGKVLREAFTMEPVIEREPPLKKVVEEHAEVYTEADKKVLEKRLSDLGYLE
jgi:predicted AlkP superfamily phosphohydrolase/phosphomutase